MSTVHIRHDGQSHDIDFDEVFPQDRLASIGIEDNTEVNPHNLTQENVKTAVAQYLDVGISEFDDHQVEFSKNGNITIRPDAVFGN